MPGSPPVPAPTPRPEPSTPPAGGDLTDCFDTAYPPELRREEARLVLERRRWVNERSEEEPLPTETTPREVAKETVGFALSGGGIRSATFCLGFFQALAQYGLVRKIDFLSSVSGGGYFASFLGALVTRADERETPKSRQGVLGAEAQLRDLHSEPLEWLRESGRYMSPNGAGDEVLAAAVYLRNWAAIQIVLFTMLLTVFSAAHLVWAALAVTWDLGEGLGSWVPASPYASPYLLAPAATLLLLAAPLAWAYWFTQRTGERESLSEHLPWLTALLALMAPLAVAILWPDDPEPWWLAVLLAVISALAFLSWGAAYLRAGKVDSKTRFMRNRLSTWLARWLWITLGLLAFALVDSVGGAAYAFTRGYWSWGAMASATGLAGLLTLGRRLIAVLGIGAGKERPRLPPRMAAALASLLVVAVLLVAADAVSHGFLWGWKEPGRPDSLKPIAALFLTTLVLTAAFGHCMKFLNLSSHQALYAARLTRAYLGASNKNRWRPAAGPASGGSKEGRNLTEVIDGDEMPMKDYSPPRLGGPLHLINVTFNETLRGESQIEQRDRKGIPLAVGPCGLSAGVRHHALWGAEDGHRSTSCVRPLGFQEGRFHIFAGRTDSEHEVEPLDLGNWTSISGAAFTTGLGARTSLGLSTLLGLANIRLGYWWDSHVKPGERVRSRTPPGLTARLAELMNGALPVQTHLLHELLARFYGPNRRRWYLSDGGHFENTACYELIRRRVNFIVVCDDGQDEDYSLQDLANLVRKARTDFKAEIEPFTSEDLLKHLDPQLHRIVGTFDDLRALKAGSSQPENAKQDEPGFSRAHATLAWVYYHDHGPDPPGAVPPPQVPGSVILFVKPTLTGDEPPDVREYRRSHPRFPQEPTSDQYFDEAQWESYRKLGEHIGRSLFDPSKKAGGWSPAGLRMP